MTRSMPMPVWSEHEGLARVLIEATDVAKRGVIERVLTDEGFAVQTCGGPEATDDRCPLASAGECSGVAGADVVVHAMRHSDPRNREVLLAIQRQYPEVPVVVEAPAPLVERYPEDFEFCHVVHQPVSSAELVAAVKAAVASR